MPSPNQIRPFSTAARVYPPILPYMHTSKRVSRRWVGPVIAIAAVGTGIAAGQQIYAQDRQDREARAREAEEMHQRQKMLMEAYGDRTNLGELERAVQVYEKS